MFFNARFTPMNVPIKPVHYKEPKEQGRNPSNPVRTYKEKPYKPCLFCTFKGFKVMHYPLSKNWGVGKLSSEYIIKIMDKAKVCVSCGCGHQTGYLCKLNFPDGNSNICTKNCTQNGLLLNCHACNHSENTPTVSVSKIGSDRSMYSSCRESSFWFLLIGNSVQHWLSTRPHCHVHPSAHPWQHVETIIWFFLPKKNILPMVLLSTGARSPGTTWSRDLSTPPPLTWRTCSNSTVNFNTVCITSLYIHDLQEHLLLTVSAEQYSDPSTCEKLAQINKENEILDIMNSTFVDKDNHKVSVQCLYTENLNKLGENHYGATKRIHTLHVKISDKPQIATEMDSYIQGEVDNGNYIPIKPNKSCKKFQLHFVRYNFIVSATSSSTKVRMTTDSSMCSKSCLRLLLETFPASEGSSCLQGPKILCRVRHNKKSLLLCSPPTRTLICELCVFHPTQSPPLLPPTPPGSITETELFLLEILFLEIMPLVPRLLQPVPSFKNLLLICNPPSSKPSWKTLILTTKVLELILPPNYPSYNKRSVIFSAREDSSSKPGNAPVRTEPASTLGWPGTVRLTIIF